MTSAGSVLKLRMAPKQKEAVHERMVNLERSRRSRTKKVLLFQPTTLVLLFFNVILLVLQNKDMLFFSCVNEFFNGTFGL